jgi:hypothetical protein
MMRISNPLMELASAKRIASLPSDAKAALDDLLGELADHAERLAEHSWRKRKGPMAAYWRAVAVYARHTRRLCRMEHKITGRSFG